MSIVTHWHVLTRRRDALSDRDRLRLGPSGCLRLRALAWRMLLLPRQAHKQAQALHASDQQAACPAPHEQGTSLTCTHIQTFNLGL